MPRTKAHGQIRQSQVIYTWGPGALLDLPTGSVMVAGLETWNQSSLTEIDEPRLVHKLQVMTDIRDVRIYQPPAASTDPREKTTGIGVRLFPEWFVAQPKDDGDTGNAATRSRRLVHRKALDDRGRFEQQEVVPTRFVRACPLGHIDDLDWFWFVHGPNNPCRGDLWLVETGTSGDLSELLVRCGGCKKTRALVEAKQVDRNPLGTCRGNRPWLGSNTREDCSRPSRLLIRTAANAYFPHVMSVLSLPDRVSDLQRRIDEQWDDLQIVDDLDTLAVIKRKPVVTQALAAFTNEEVLKGIRRKKHPDHSKEKVKTVEIQQILSAPEGFGDDVPINENFHARRLPDTAWRHSKNYEAVESLIQLHRLREVSALVGFTRFESVTPNIHGEYDSDVERAALAAEPSWFPAIENRGEGIFIQLRSDAIDAWLARPNVKDRLETLQQGHARWWEPRSKTPPPFPGGAYIVLHTLSHLLIQSLSVSSGYPISSIRERIYAEERQFGILLYTASPDADGTLGGLVQQARQMETHLHYALDLGKLCSNDPICAQHSPAEQLGGRLLTGAACHGCVLLPETSCEMRNDYLDRSLVISGLGVTETALFSRA